MIGILIKYKEKTMFSKLPKDSAKLERQISGIGLDVPLGAVNLSNHNDHGYEIEIFTQDKFDDEIVSHIVSKDDLAQLNALLEYVSKESAEEMYRRICDSFADSVSELHKKLTASATMEADEKLRIRTCLNHKAMFYEPSECVVEKIISVTTEEFHRLLDETLDDNDFIKDNRMLMYTDENDAEHCLLIYDRESGDGLLINAEGYDYARYSAFVPNAMEIAEMFEMERSGLRTVKAPVTDSERRLLDLISRAADRMATFAHLGSSDFTFNDVLSDLDCSPEDIKNMLIHAVAQKLESKPDIASVKVSTLDTPLQPEITVLTKEEMEETAAETEELSGLSF